MFRVNMSSAVIRGCSDFRAVTSRPMTSSLWVQYKICPKSSATSWPVGQSKHSGEVVGDILFTLSLTGNRLWSHLNRTVCCSDESPDNLQSLQLLSQSVRVLFSSARHNVKLLSRDDDNSAWFCEIFTNTSSVRERGRILVSLSGACTLLTVIILDLTGRRNYRDFCFACCHRNTLGHR